MEEVECTDFGFDLVKTEIDGDVKCLCGKELHFTIKKEKLKEIIDAIKMDRESE